MNVVIGDPKSNEAEILFQIEVENYREGEATELSTFEEILECHEDGDDFYLFQVARLEDKVVGFYCGVVEEDIVNLVDIAVAKKFQGKRVGDQLFHHFLNTLPDHTVGVTLKVRRNNTPAIKLYEKHKFKVVEVIEDYYEDGEAAIAMKKDLA